jgi:hypothetical protein
MVMNGRARLRIYTSASMLVSDASVVLTTTQNAYNGIYLYFKIVDRIALEVNYLQRIERYGPPLEWFLERGFIRPQWITSFLQEFPESRFETNEDNVNLPDRLVLSAVQISSPGFWEMLAKFNPLEVMRSYLNDRHERRKDREYREDAEQEALYLQNELLRNKVLEERLKILREFKDQADLYEMAYDQLLGRSAEKLFYRPLRRMGALQDQRLIDGAIILPEDENYEPSRRSVRPARRR